MYSPRRVSGITFSSGTLIINRLERKIIAKSLYNYYCVLLKTNCICTVAFFNHVNNHLFLPELETFNMTTYIITRYQQTVSLDCPFWITPVVFSNVCLQINSTLYINAVFRLVDKRGILYQFFVFFLAFPPSQ